MQSDPEFYQALGPSILPFYLFLLLAVEDGIHDPCLRTTNPFTNNLYVGYHESRHFDVLEHIYECTQDAFFSYALKVILDTGFSLSYGNQVLYKHLLLPRPSL